MYPGVKARLALALFLLCSLATCATDWPARRRGVAPVRGAEQRLPGRLQLQWVRRLPPLAAAWPDQPKLQADAVYQPVVLGQRLFVGSSRHDTLTAYDTNTGRELWRFHANGPVR